MRLHKKAELVIATTVAAFLILLAGFILVSQLGGITGFATFQQNVSSCVAEDVESTKGSFGDACDDITGALLELDDGLIETHTYRANRYGGVEIQSVNTGITNCASVESVIICYEWWATPGDTLTDCDVSVDANEGASYTAVTTVCPGTSADPGITCTNVTLSETWTCANFFGAAGTRAQAKSELSRTDSGGATTASWDVLFFNVSYTESDTEAPKWTLPIPTSATLEYAVESLTVDFNATDNVGIDNYFVNDSNFDINGSGYMTNATLLAVGVYPINVSVNDTSGNENTTIFTVTVQDTIAPTFTSIFNITVDDGNDVTAQFMATDLSGINNWYVNDSRYYRQ